MTKSNPIDDFLVHKRLVIAIVFIVAFAFFFVTFVAGLAERPILGLSVYDALAGFVALATAALAFAAMIQAIMAAEKRREDLAPRLDLQLVRVSATGPNPFAPGLDPPPEAVVAGQFFLQVPASPHAYRIVLRNLGPGGAVGIDVTAYFWKSRAGVSSLGQRPSNPLPRPSDYSEEYGRSFALRPDEDRSFPLEFFRRDPAGTGPPGESYRILEQFVVAAGGTDVAGRGAKAPDIGFFLTDVTPIGTDHLQTFWKRFTDSEATVRVPR
ncbi:MAG: hypothetical protein WB947_00575 [Thermoplasmata archaeon]